MKPLEKSESAAGPARLLQAAGLSNQVGFVLRFAQMAVWDDLVATFQPFALRPVHYSVLSILRAASGCRQQEVGEALGILRPNLVTLIDGLEARELLRRKVHPDDRRSHALYLTADGIKVLEEMDRAHAKHERRVNALFSKAERAEFMESLLRLARLGDNTPL